MTWVGFTCSVHWKTKELFQPYSNFCPSTCWNSDVTFHSGAFAAKFSLRERRFVSLTSRRTRRWWWAAAESARTPHSQQSASRTEAVSYPCSETAGKKIGISLVLSLFSRFWLLVDKYVFISFQHTFDFQLSRQVMKKIAVTAMHRNKVKNTETKQRCRQTHGRTWGSVVGMLTGAVSTWIQKQRKIPRWLDLLRAPRLTGSFMVQTQRAAFPPPPPSTITAVSLILWGVKVQQTIALKWSLF